MPQNRTALIVYLDSSDYSELSNPRRQSADRDALRDEFLRWSNSRKVLFTYSGVHLSEMAPLDPAYSPAATARADLLVALCKRNCFISFDELIKRELKEALSDQPGQVRPLSDDGGWFPAVDDILPPVRLAPTVLEEVDAIGKKRGANREQRRMLKRQLFKGNQRPKIMTRELLAKAQLETDEIVKRYPMRPQDAEVMGKYVLGRASRDEAKSAFLNSLRDPHWMMRWFADRHDNLNTLSTWFRGPAQKMEGLMRDLSDKTKLWRRAASLAGRERELSRYLSSKGWANLQDELLVNVAAKLAFGFFPGYEKTLTPELLDAHCPGLATAIRSMHSSLWTAMGAQPREPEDNDFVDAMHALYAPYCDLFRADRYMSSHVRKHTERYGTEVVSGLKDLLARIQARVRAGKF